MLPASLRKLCHTLKIKNTKGYFPFNLTDINYNGIFPKYYNWTDITNKEWNKLKSEHGNRLWNFKN